MFINPLVHDWLRQIRDIDARLQSDPPARVADVGCGTGWSSIAIACANSKILVVGIDVDETSIELPRANAAEAGLTDRLSFYVRDAADATLAQRYDLVTAFETLNDMARPVEALKAMRSRVADGGRSLSRMSEWATRALCCAYQPYASMPLRRAIAMSKCWRSSTTSGAFTDSCPDATS